MMEAPTTPFFWQKSGANKIVSLKPNRGLGVAFRTGINEALKMKADILVNIDADGQFNGQDIPKLVAPILSGKADMVTCSRFLEKGKKIRMPWIKKFGNSIFTSIVNFLTNQNFTDTQCGFRAYSSEAMLRMVLFGKHTYTQEVFLSLAKSNLAITEVNCDVVGEREGKSKVVGNVFLYGIKALLIIVRAIRDYEPLAFFGSIGAAVLALGVALEFAVFINWVFTSMTAPFTSLISVGGVLIITGFLLLMLAFLADMNGRQREMQKEILYLLKKQEFKKEF